MEDQNFPFPSNLQQRQNNETVNYHIQFLDGEIISMSNNPNETIENIISYLNQNFPHKKPPDKEFMLMFAGHVIEKDERIGNISRLNGFTINCFVHNGEINQQHEENNQLQGFDKLINYGLTQVMINRFRLLFHGARNSPNDIQQMIQAEEEVLPFIIYNNHNPPTYTSIFINMMTVINNPFDDYTIDQHDIDQNNNNNQSNSDNEDDESSVENNGEDTDNDVEEFFANLDPDALASLSSFAYYLAGLLVGLFLGLLTIFLLWPLLERPTKSFSFGITSGLLIRTLFSEIL